MDVRLLSDELTMLAAHSNRITRHDDFVLVCSIHMLQSDGSDPAITLSCYTAEPSRPSQ